MTAKEFEHVGRWFFKVLPQITGIAISQMNAHPLLKDHKDINILFDAFSEYHGINFPACLKTLTPHNGTEYKMKFVALFLSCYEPNAILGPYYKNLGSHSRIFLSNQLYTSGCQISQYLPKIRFYVGRLNHYECEIQQMAAIVKLKRDLLFSTMINNN